MKKPILFLIAGLGIYGSVCLANNNSENNTVEEPEIFIETITNGTPTLKKDITINDAIEWMFDYQLTEFDTEDKFRANDYITREESAKVLMKFYVNILGKDNPNIQNFNMFYDIGEINPKLADFVLEANMIGIFNGVKHKFLPKNNIKQSQAIAVVIRFLDGNLDADKGFWFKNYVEKAQTYGLLEGLDFGNNSSINKNYITRGQLALLLYNTYVFLKGGLPSDNVINYNNKLVDILDLCIHDKDVFVSLNIKGNNKNTRLLSEINKCDIALKQINKLDSRNGDSSLKDAVQSVIIDAKNLYVSLLSQKDVKDNENFNEIKKQNTQLNENIENMLNIQFEFANKYNYTLD